MIPKPFNYASLFADASTPPNAVPMWLVIRRDNRKTIGRGSYLDCLNGIRNLAGTEFQGRMDMRREVQHD